MSSPRIKSSLHIGVFSTYVPRECGIATFVRDVVVGIRETLPNAQLTVCAISDGEYEYPSEVKYTIRQSERSDYKKAAEFFNQSDVDVVLIQHEFGIFGGFNGSYLLDFLSVLKKPSIISLHTVPMLPSSRRHVSRVRLLKKITSLVDATIVTIPSAIRFFVSEGFSAASVQRMYVVPHGAPVVSTALQARRDTIRTQMDISKEQILILTYGLITPKKGIHYALRAMRKVATKHPNAIYLVAGRMHPYKPKEYMLKLESYVQKHGLSQQVRFLTRYLEVHEILELLVATDIYLVPYLTKEQVSSGTMAYAVAAGKAIVSTAFAYARDTLGDGRGLLVDFASSDSIAVAVNKLIESPDLRHSLAEKTHEFGLSLPWKIVGEGYVAIIEQHRRKNDSNNIGHH